jgi:PAS domain S-box-containing protein
MADRTQLLESALDSLTEGLALADRDGSVGVWNCAAEAITGFARAEIIGQGVRGMRSLQLGTWRWCRYATRWAMRFR